MEWKWIIIITTKYVVKFPLLHDPSNLVEFIPKNNMAENNFTAGRFVSISGLSGKTYETSDFVFSIIWNSDHFFIVRGNLWRIKMGPESKISVFECSRFTLKGLLFFRKSH